MKFSLSYQRLAYIFNVFIHLGHRSESRYTNKYFRERSGNIVRTRRAVVILPATINKVEVRI